MNRFLPFIVCLALCTKLSTPGFAQSVGLAAAEPTSETSEEFVPTVAATQAAILSYTDQRADMLLSADPQNSRALDRLSSASLFGAYDSATRDGASTQTPLSFSESGTDQNGSFSVATSLAQLNRESASNGLDVWTQANADLSGAQSVAGQNDSAFTTADLGIDYLTMPSLLVGTLLEVDSLAQSASDFPTAVRTGGNGNAWMAGPYMALQILPNVLIGARAGIGDANDHVDPTDHDQDGYSTLSALSELDISGNWAVGDFHFEPTSRATFFEAQQQGFRGSNDELIPGQLMTIAGTSLGPKVSYDLSENYYGGLVIEPAFAVNAVWNVQRDVTTLDPQVEGGLSAETELSTEIKTASGLSLKGSLDYSGIGDQQVRDFKALLAINLPLSP